MKKNIGNQILAALLLTFVIFLAGCGRTAGNDSSKADGAWQSSGTETGVASSYREEELTLPDDSAQILAIHQADSEIWLITENGVYSSDDSGSSWKKLEEQSSRLPADAAYAAISDSGKLAFYSESDGVLVYGTDGTVTAMDVSFGESAMCYGLSFADDDTLTARDHTSAIYIMDVSDGSVTATIPSDDESHYYYAPVNGRILTITADGVKIYDYNGELQEGNEIIGDLVSADFEAWTTTSGGGGITEDAEGTGIFYAGKSGLYHYTWGGSVAEQLFEGSATKLGDSDYALWSITASGASCVLCGYRTADGDDALVRYSFSGSSQAAQTLTLYTLYENELLTDEVNTFNQNSAELQVTIEVGLADEGGLTADDAIKTLNTEILAGDGPDIIILDGMDVESYSGSGMLTDLSGVLSEIQEAEGLYENIAYTYETEEGAVYAVPARFQIMMMVGTEENLDKITDLDSLCGSVKSWKEENPEITSIIGLYDERLLELMTELCSPAWLTAEGELDESAIREFLESVKSINDTQKENVSQADIDEFDGETTDSDEIAAAFNTTSRQSAVIGLFQSKSLNTTASVMQYLDEDQVYRSAVAQSSNVFIPSQILGINAYSPNQEAALEFVKGFLSSECQSELSISDRGYPINKTGFWQMAEDVLEAVDSGAEGGWGVSAEELQEMFNNIEEIVSELSNRSITDAVITDSVQEEGMKYLSGETDIDGAVSSIMQKAELRNME